MLSKPGILSLFPNSFNNSIKHERSGKILYVSSHKVVDRVGCFTLIVLLFLCACLTCVLMPLPDGVMG